MKKLLFLLCLYTTGLPAQEAVPLETILQEAMAHYPLFSQRNLIEESRHFSLAALNRAYLPQLNINGQASYQSEVTSLPFTLPLPGVSIEPLDKDQYKIVADVSQILYDGGNINNQKQIQRAGAQVEQGKINVEMQKMRERVRQFYLGVLMMDEQIRQTDLVESDLQAGIKRMDAAVRNGTAFRSQLAQLQAEELKNNQRRNELKSTRIALLKSLSLFTGKTYEERVQFIRPEVITTNPLSFTIQRPELGLFMAQDSLVESQKKLLGSKSLPRLSLFAQGGYGRPGLNMLQNSFEWFYIAGARLNWNLGALYSLGAERKVNTLQRSSIQVQKELYLLNANITVEQYRNDIQKYRLLLKDDAAIISLREEIMKASKAQLDNGVITSSDYLREVNAADQARQMQLLHNLQLLQVQLDYNDYIEHP